MDVLEKIRLLGNAGSYDVCSGTCPVSKDVKNTVHEAALNAIYKSIGQDGKCIYLFKTLYSNECSFDCKYCQNSVSCRKKAATYNPEQLAKTFIHLMRT